MAVLLPRA